MREIKGITVDILIYKGCKWWFLFISDNEESRGGRMRDNPSKLTKWWYQNAHIFFPCGIQINFFHVLWHSGHEHIKFCDFESDTVSFAYQKKQTRTKHSMLISGRGQRMVYYSNPRNRERVCFFQNCTPTSEQRSAGIKVNSKFKERLRIQSRPMAFRADFLRGENEIKEEMKRNLLIFSQS